MGRRDALRRMATPDALAVVALAVVATSLRFSGIGSQLWLDEISALTGSIERPFGAIATQWPGSASHILYELLARAGLLAAGVPAGIRLPAALFGVAGVLLAWAFARRAFGARQALVIGGLHAVSYHHVMFSQNARGYTLLIALYLATLVLLVEASRRARPSRWLLGSYAVAGALAAYSMPMGIFILPGQALVAFVAWWRGRAQGGTPWPALAGSAVGGGVLAALLYAPFVPAMLRFTRMNAATPEEGPRLGIGLVREVLDGLLGAFHGPAGLTVVAVFGVIGLVTWWQRHALSLWLAIAPIVLEAGAVVATGIGIHPRYFAIVLPVLLVVAGLGLDTVVAAVAERTVAAGRRRAAVIGGVLTVAVLVSAVPLGRYYRYPKQDFLGAVGAVNARQPACGARVGVDVAGHVLTDYYRAGFATAENLDDLRAIESRTRPGRVCAVTTLEGLLATSDPEVVEYLRREYRRVAWLPGTVGDAAMRIYERDLP